MNCHKPPYKTKKIALRRLKMYNKIKNSASGSVYHCHQHQAYHITNKDELDYKNWEMIKNDYYIQHQLG